LNPETALDSPFAPLVTLENPTRRWSRLVVVDLDEYGN
jgi:hypothetical protein